MIDTHCNDYDDYLADDDNDDKDDDKATMILGANDNDGRYREDKSMTFFKQVSVKLEIRVSEEPPGAQGSLFPGVLLADEQEGEPVNEVGVGVEGPKDGRAERNKVNCPVKYLE